MCRVFIVSLLLLALITLNQSDEQAHRAYTNWYNYSYADVNRWGSQFPGCRGQRQSPINVATTGKFEPYSPRLYFKHYNKPLLGKLVLQNDGHTALFEIPITSWGTKPSISGGRLKTRYEAQSLHFHWGSPTTKGSEHMINGQRFDLEMHIVHKNVQYGTMEEARRYRDGIAVLAVMINIVDHADSYYPGLNKILDQLPQIIWPGTNATINAKLTLSHVLGDVDTKQYYAYDGSLTTPPCTEAVIWHIFTNPLLVARAETAKFFQLYGSDGAPLINNFRPLQSLNNRSVFHRRSILRVKLRI